MSVKEDKVNLVVTINGDAGRKELNSLDKEARELKASMKGINKESEDYINKSKRLKEVETKMQALRAEIGLNSKSLRELNQELRSLQSVRQYLIPGTQAFKDNEAAVKSVKGRITELNGNLKDSGGLFGFLGKEIKAFGVLAAGYLGFQFITTQISNIIQKNATLSDSLTNVAKTTGLTDKEIKELQKDLRAMDTRSSQKELLDLATVAGKLGISAKTDVVEFVRAADQIKIALAKDLGDNVEDSINTIGKLTNIFKLREKFGIEDSMLKVGSAINALGAASEASEAYLVEFSKRFGGIAPNANISIQDVLGLAATMDTLGQTSEVSTTSIGQLLVAMGKDVPAFAKLAGMSTKEFGDILEKDANAALIKLLENLKSSKGGVEGMAEKLNALGIDGSRSAGVIGVLSNNIGALKKQQALSNEEFEKGTSLTEEFNKANNNFAAQLEKLQKNLAGLFINNGFSEFFMEVVSSLNRLIEGSDKYLQKSVEVIKSNNQQAGTAKRLLAEYESLNKEGVIPTTEQKTRLKQITIELRDAFGDNVVQINKETGALELNIQKTKDAIKQKLLLANQEAGSLALKSDNLKDEIASGKEALKQTMDEIEARKGIVTSYGISMEQADRYYKIILEGGAGSVALSRQLSVDQMNAIQNYNNALTEAGQLNSKLNEQTKERQAILKSLKELGFKDTDVEALFNTLPATPAGPASPVNVDAIQNDVKQVKVILKDLYRDIEKDKLAALEDGEQKERIILEANYAEKQQKAKDNLLAVQKSTEISEADKIKFKNETDNYLLILEGKFQEDKTNLALKWQNQRNEDEYNQSVTFLSDWYEQEKLDLKTQLANKEISQKVYDAKMRKLEEDLILYKIQLQKDYNKDSVKLQQELLDKRGENANKEKEEETAQSSAMHDFLKKYGLASKKSELEERIALIRQSAEEAKEAYAEESKERVAIDKAANKAIYMARAEYANDLAQTVAGYYAQIEQSFAQFINLQNVLDQNKLQQEKTLGDRKKKKLKKDFDEGIISKAEYEAKNKEIEDDYEAKARAAKKKAWERQRIADSISAAINTSVAVTKALTAGPVVGPILAGIVAAAGLAQIVAINSAKPPEFAKGGVLPGPSAQKDNLDVYDPTTGNKVATVKSGEPVLSEETYRNNPDLVNALLQASINGGGTINLDDLPGRALVNSQAQDGRALVNGPLPAMMRGGILGAKFNTPRMIDVEGANQAMMMSKFGSASGYSAAGVGTSSNNMADAIYGAVSASNRELMEDMSRLVAEQVKEAIESAEIQGVWEWDRYKKGKARMEKIEANASA